MNYIVFSYIFGVFGLGAWEIVLIVFAILVLFGAKKIPEFAKGLGQGIKEFKNASNSVKNEIQKEIDQASEQKESDKTIGSTTKKD